MLSWLHSLAGDYTGNSRLWMSPSDPPRTCVSVAAVSLVALGKFVKLDYTWEFDGSPQSGSLLFGYESKRQIATAVWIDSWHMGDKSLACEGTVTENGIEVLGSYEAPPGPNWGWRTRLERADAGAFRLVMYNISPDGQEDLAVEAIYRRNSL